MSVETATVADFLLARIAEDEAAATGEVRGRSWDAEAGGVVVVGMWGTVASCKLDDLSLIGAEGYTYPPNSDVLATATHIARWDPARVLAECEAKRRIVAIHAAVIHDVYPPDVAPACRTCGEFSEYARPWPCPTIRLLALPFVDHPDYREEWRP